MFFYLSYMVLQIFTMLLMIFLAYKVILAKNSKTQLSNVILIMFTLFYMIGYFLEHTSHSLEVMKAVVKIEYFGQCGFLLANMWFIDTFCNNNRHAKWLYRFIFLLIIAVLLCVFNLEHNTLFYTSLDIHNYGSYAILKVEPGILYFIFYIFHFVIFFRSEVLCYKKLKKSSGHERKSCYWILAAPVLMIILSFVKWSGLSQGFDLMACGLFGFTTCMTVAIVRYDYIDAVRVENETDELTGVSNRRYFTKRIRSLLKSHVSGALIMFDMDNFKYVNDSFGHGIGDKVLEAFGETLRDIVADEYLAARFGGDEFILFLQHTTVKEELEDFAEKIHVGFRQKQQEKNVPCEVNCSIGIALTDIGGESFEKLYEKADKALYLAKNSGKDQWRFYA